MLVLTSTTAKIFLFICLVIFLANDFTLAQFFYFGRNKVQYEEFDWKILRTDHFDIYYYGEMEHVAELVGYAEEIYAELKVR
jgi:hypothetical protein